MTYSPGGPGYPSPSQQSQPPSSYGAPGQYSPQQQSQPQGPATTPTEPGPSQLPLFVSIAVVVLGIAVYLASFAPFTSVLDTALSVGTALNLPVLVALIGGLVAGLGLLPKQTKLIGVAAVLSVAGALGLLLGFIAASDTEWGILLVLVLAFLQAIAAVVAVLFDSEILTPPVPRPKYEQQPYGYGGPGGYYGQQGPGQQGPGPQQRQGGYPPQQSYGGYQQGPNTGGFQAPAPQQSQPGGQHSQAGQHSQQDGPATPPTGFPTYGQPPSGSQSSANNQPTTQVPTAQAQPPAAPPQSSGPAPS